MFDDDHHSNDDTPTIPSLSIRKPSEGDPYGPVPDIANALAHTLPSLSKSFNSKFSNLPSRLPDRHPNLAQTSAYLFAQSYPAEARYFYQQRQLHLMALYHHHHPVQSTEFAYIKHSETTGMGSFDWPEKKQALGTTRHLKGVVWGGKRSLWPRTNGTRRAYASGALSNLE